mmetsp:Transcript_9700/g.25088  ORF Transcript_9700/g.25088 Transcript_9700/m.25088 type:complete len:345 (+) Transcript_9700:90-1124(+)
MPNFNFPDQRDNKQANYLFAGRGCIICVSLLGFIPAGILWAASRETFAAAGTKKWFSMAEPQDATVFWGVCQTSMPAGGTCEKPSSSTTDKKKCLYPLSATQYSGGFKEYKQACVKKGLVPVIIEDEKQNNDVVLMLGENTPAWIGLEKTLGEWRLSGSGALPAYTNWHADEPNSGDGKDLKEDYAVVGMGNLKLLAGALFIGALVVCACALLTIIVVCVMCCIQYRALLNKNDGMLTCVSLCDACCGCLSCLGILAGVREAIAAGGSVSAITIIVRIICTVVLFGMAYIGWILKTKIICQRQGQQVAQPVILGQPVMGQPVMGQPVMGQPVTGQPIMGQHVKE